MTKAGAKQKVAAEIPETDGGPLNREKFHELFGLAAPYEPLLPPMRLRGFATFWHPGVSVRSLVK